jgi:hypothetical protein
MSEMDSLSRNINKSPARGVAFASVCQLACKAAHTGESVVLQKTPPGEAQETFENLLLNEAPNCQGACLGKG